MEESTQYKERRTYKRSIFAPEENAFGVFLWPGSDDLVHVRIMNLHRDGIGFGFLRNEIDPPKVEQKFQLVAIEIGDGHRLEIPDLALEVRWVIDHESLNHVGFGCEFINISKKQQDSICDFVNAIFPDRMA